MTEEKNETKKTPPKYERLFDLPFGVDEYTTGEKRFSRAPAYVIVGVVGGICKVLWRYKTYDREKLDALAAVSDAYARELHVEQAQAAIHACPFCGKPLVERRRADDGGVFIGCSGYPACDYIESIAGEGKRRFYRKKKA